MPTTKVTDANTMQMTAEKNKPVNKTFTGNETEWRPPPPPRPGNRTRPKKQTKMQQATTEICCESSKDPLSLSRMGNTKHTERGKGLSVRVGSFGWRNDLPFPVSTSGWGRSRDSDRTHIIQPDLNGGT